jgi:hypothetical protein
MTGTFLIYVAKKKKKKLNSKATPVTGREGP